ncbi:MAG: hypothetical protein JXQ73_33595 [Phycisphaerae bacterium]|nr:hypothetical protein [Phycisphaerae bacterium]
MTHSDVQDHPDIGAAAARMTAHRDELDRQYRSWRSSELRWSSARLVTFIAAVVGLVLLRETATAAIVVAGFFLILLALAVRKHLRLWDQCEFGRQMLDVASESLQRCGGRLAVIRYGDRPADPDDPDGRVPTLLPAEPASALTEQERDDLDLYARPAGIFGLLNRASTSLGARRLRDLLENPLLSPEPIKARQACVRWLAENGDARIRLMGAAAGLRKHDARLDAFVKAVRTAKPLPGAWLATLARLWSIPSAAFVVFACTQTGADDYGWAVGIIVLLCLNGLLFMKLRPALRHAIEPWRELPPAARAFLRAARQAETDLPDDNDLARVRDKLTAAARHNVLPSLCSRLAWSDTGGFLHVLFNLMFFYDVHVAQAVLHRLLPNKDALIDATGALADLEALCGLACFAFEQPVACMPAITDTPRLYIQGGAHPLIEPAELVANDLDLSPDERTWIVTGSNMAGKSTFLRMVGVNVLLAQIGTAATARDMSLSPLRLITDLRIRDDLAKHESYFLAEVRQLHRMLKPRHDGIALLGLIDEPFRGTNSQERVAADVAVIDHLITSPHFFLVATHEYELTRLGDQPGVRNVHFHEELIETGPVFDYRLRQGPATTRNALRILEREGYPEVLVRRAQAYLAAPPDPKE